MDPIIYEQNRQRMAKVGMALGIAAFACSIIMFSAPFLAIFLGAFAVLISVLSKGKNLKYDNENKIGLATGIIALAICFIVIFSVFTALKNNPEYRKNVSELVATMYGSEFEDEYGVSVTEALDEVLGK